MDQTRLPLPTLTAPPLAHDLLIAGMAVRQASTRTAAVAERLAQPEMFDDASSALVAFFAEGDNGAADALRGSFHPRVARAASGKARSTLMKTGFTLAF